jgi:hypothetical protein
MFGRRVLEIGIDDGEASGERHALVSIREQIESLESLVIRWWRTDSRELPDVDERKPCAV